MAKVLISAFSCAPKSGSEPGIAWNLASTLARHHRIWLILDEHNRPHIQKYAEAHHRENLTLVFLGLPGILSRLYTDTWRVYCYYGLWQLYAYLTVRNLHRTVRFDIVHHISFANSWVPVWLGWLGVPFVWNAGVREVTPYRLMRFFSWRSRLVESLRNVVTRVGWIVTRYTTEQRADVILSLGRGFKDHRLSAIGCGTISAEDLRILVSLPLRACGTIRIATIGRLVGWKGQVFGLRAFAKLIREYSACEYWIIGDGPDRRFLQALARKLGCSDQVRFLGWLPRERTLDVLSEIDIVVHPSLRDSFGTAVVEAMAAGRPVICLDTGAPASIVRQGGGIVVPVSRNGDLCELLHCSLRRLVRDVELRHRLGREAREIAIQYAADRQSALVSATYDRLTSNAAKLPPELSRRGAEDANGAMSTAG